jgi:hypothetical protein
MNILVHVDQFLVEMFVVQKPSQLKRFQIVFFLDEDEDEHQRRTEECEDERDRRLEWRHSEQLERTSDIHREETR